MVERIGNGDVSPQDKDTELIGGSIPLGMDLPPEEERRSKHMGDVESEPPPQLEVKVAVIGNVDSGKSTLVGVLSKCVLDDGRGLMRGKVLQHGHELNTGRTSSIGHEIMGFDSCNRQVVPERLVNLSRNQAWCQVVEEGEKILTLVDLCGHEKYLKTTIFGLMGEMPDYAMVLVGANMGVSRMTKEHLGVTLTLKVPLFVVITKVDLSPPEVTKKTTESIVKILKQQGKTPIVISEGERTGEYAETVIGRKSCPIFPISNVTGQGMQELREFLSLLPSRGGENPLLGPMKEKVEYVIDGHYQVPGVGMVVAGTLLSGTVTPGTQLKLGPKRGTGEFVQVVVRSIHNNRVLVNVGFPGQSLCFNIKSKEKEGLKREVFRKGMVLLGKSLQPLIAYEFSAEVMILHHATTIQEDYQAVIHCGVIRQVAKVLSIAPKDCMRTGDKGTLRFKFMYHPEWIKSGMTVLFREGRTKGIGVVTDVDYLTNNGGIGTKAKGKGKKKK